MKTLYFIRVRDQFVHTFEDKLKSLHGVLRIEQVSVLGGPAKAENTFRIAAGREHTMLIVRALNNACDEVEKILDAGKLLDAVYQFEKCPLAE